MNKILDIKNLRSYYGGICALDGVSLHINEGEITSIIGSNGAGKSTLMKVIAGDKPIDSGDVIFQGEPLPKAVHQVVAKGISLVPEGRRIFASLSVKENLILGTCPHKNFRKAMDDSLEEVLELFPILKKRLNQSWWHLVRRRTANAGYRPRHDGKAPVALSGRTFSGPCAHRDR